MSETQCGDAGRAAEESSELISLERIHTELQKAAGTEVDQQKWMLLAANLVDDSASIETYGNVDAVIRGHNAHLDTLMKANNVRIATRYLNGEKLSDYRKPSRAVRMSRENYDPRLGTPLYKGAIDFLQGNVLRLVHKLETEQKKVLTFNTIFSDGENTEATEFTPDHVRQIVEPMLATRKHIIAAIGVRGGVDFYQIYRAMGIPEQWIRVIERNDADIEKAFRDVGEKTMTASMSMDDFTQTSMTGFDRRKKK